MRGGGEVAIKGGDRIGAIGNGLSTPSHVAVVLAPGSGAGGVVGAADAEVLPCVPCAGSGVCAGEVSDGVANDVSIECVSSSNLARVVTG